jgi:type I restriction enzyme M protein
MANSASDARASELEIRKKIIELGVVDIMVSVGPKFFYTVTLPCTLWFFDKNKKDRKDKILFIDAKNVFTN